MRRRERTRLRPNSRRVLPAIIGLLAGLVVLAPAPARADTLITVTTTGDVVDGSDEHISLREAFDMAQAAADPVQITLAPSATYELTLCSAPGPTFNRQGILETTTAQPVTIHGTNSTIRQTCAGQAVLRVGTPSDGSGPGTGTLTIDHLSVEGGKGAEFGAIGAGGGLTADTLHVTGTVMTVGGDRRAAVVSGRATTVVDSTIDGTDGGAGLNVLRGGDFSTTPLLTISGSTISNNSNPLGSIGGVASAHDISMTDTWVLHNTASMLSAGASGAVGGVQPGAIVGSLTMTGGGISHNTGRTAGATLGILKLTNTTIADNIGHSVGGFTGDIDLDRVSVRANHGDIVGGFIATGSIENSLIDHNIGDAYVGGGGTSQSQSPSDPHNLYIRRTSITYNSGGVAGGLLIESNDEPPAVPPHPAGHIDLTASTLMNNSAMATPSNTQAGNDFSYYDFTPASVPAQPFGTLTTASTVFGSDEGPGPPACYLGGFPVTSNGYNFASDGSCGLSHSTDVSNGLDPALRDTTFDDGPSGLGWILPVPGSASPLRDRIPNESALCAGTDQRNVVAPQGPQCDVGAVEVILGGFHPMPPHRVYDTRTVDGPILPLEARSIEVVDDETAALGMSAVVLNVTAINPTAQSHLTAFDSNAQMPPTSNLNFAPGETIANQVVVPIGNGDNPGFISLFNNSGETHVAIDIAGVFDNGGTRDDECPCGDGFAALPAPLRAMDTRTGTGGSAMAFGPGETRTVSLATLGLPADAEAVAVNLTVTNTDSASHLTVGPSEPLPIVSNLNWTAGTTIANGATVELGPNKTLRVRNNEGHAHLIVDVIGSYSPTAPARYAPITPVRTRDTRVDPGTPLGPGQTLATALARVPASSTAAFVNVTGVSATAVTHLTAWQDGAPQPKTSTLNLPAGGTRPNLTMAGKATSLSGVNTYNNAGQTHVLIDLFGYFAPNPSS